MISEEEVQQALDFIRDNADALAKASAEFQYLNAFRRSKLGIEFFESQEKTVAAREWDARRNPEYIALLNGLKVAHEEDTRLRYLIKAAQIKIEVWSTIQANQRV